METLQLGPSMQGNIDLLRVYNRYLRTSEVIGNFKAGV
jgi:hypothetical protein